MHDPFSLQDWSTRSFDCLHSPRFTTHTKAIKVCNEPQYDMQSCHVTFDAAGKQTDVKLKSPIAATKHLTNPSVESLETMPSNVNTVEDLIEQVHSRGTQIYRPLARMLRLT